MLSGKPNSGAPPQIHSQTRPYRNAPKPKKRLHWIKAAGPLISGFQRQKDRAKAETTRLAVTPSTDSELVPIAPSRINETTSQGYPAVVEKKAASPGGVDVDQTSRSEAEDLAVRLQSSVKREPKMAYHEPRLQPSPSHASEYLRLPDGIPADITFSQPAAEWSGSYGTSVQTPWEHHGNSRVSLNKFVASPEPGVKGEIQPHSQRAFGFSGRRGDLVRGASFSHSKGHPQTFAGATPPSVPYAFGQHGLRGEHCAVRPASTKYAMNPNHRQISLENSSNRPHR